MESMAIDDTLLSGQYSSMEDNMVEHSLSATAKVMPLFSGNKRARVHRTPRKTVRKAKSGENARASK